VRITVKSENNGAFDEKMLEYAEEKIGKVEKYYSDIQDTLLVLSDKKGRTSAEVTIRLHGKIIRAETEEQNLRTAIDRLTDKLESQMRKLKERMIDRTRKVSKENYATPVYNEKLIANDMTDIIRVKKFLLEPMTDEEAVEQMELLGHDFYLFFRSKGESEGLTLLYRRKNGGYGLLIPELK
jgi:putative sigma-54 modulation protein